MGKGNKYSDFKADLAFGLNKEKLVKKIITGQIPFEVKSENTRWQSSKNIAIEIECNGKPSGISVTKAKYWIHNLIADGALTGSFILPVSLLKEYLERLKTDKQYRTVYGGDGNRSLLVLIPIKNIFQIMMPVEEEII
jgi:hypothetical protein